MLRQSQLNIPSSANFDSVRLRLAIFLQHHLSSISISPPIKHRGDIIDDEQAIFCVQGEQSIRSSTKKEQSTGTQSEILREQGGT